MFDEDYIESLYRKYMSSSYDDSDAIELIKEIIEGRVVVIICPGATIARFKDRILKFVNDRNCIVISVNFVPDFLKPAITFCANAKRLANIHDTTGIQRIITSNLKENAEGDYEGIVSYNDCIYFNESFCEDSTLMLLKTLERAGNTEVYIAGFDGFSEKGADYFSKQYTHEEGKNVSVETVKNILYTALNKTNIQFITPSAYEKE